MLIGCLESYVVTNLERQDLSNQTELENAWPIISNKLAMEVSQSWEAHRPNPSGAPVRIWQTETLPAVVAGCGGGCPCVNKNPNCSTWAKQNQCEENPGYMNAVCPASCPKTSNTTGWKLTKAGLVETPSGDCLDAAGRRRRDLAASIGSGPLRAIRAPRPRSSPTLTTSSSPATTAASELSRTGSGHSPWCHSWDAAAAKRRSPSTPTVR